MDAALRQLSEHGYAKTTLKSIADEVGITSGAVYHYFPSKPALVTALLIEWATVTNERTAHVGGADVSLAERLCMLLDDAANLYDDRPELPAFTTRLVPDAVRYPELADGVVQSRKALVKFYGKLIRDARDAGELEPDVDGQGLIDLFSALTFGMATIAAASLDRHRAAVGCLESLIRGELVAAGSPASRSRRRQRR
jgi:AcrR family transcriptional regulator